MKRFIALTCFLFTIHSIASAQNPVPNSSFETWVNYITYEEPASWGTVNGETWTFGGNSPFTVKKDSNSHDGVLAAKMVTIGHQNQIFPAVMCTGKVSFSNFSCTGGFPISVGYASFSGYFKYSPAGDDSCLMFAMLTKWNAVNNKRDTVAISTFSTDSTPDYTYFSDSFAYKIAETPDSAQIILSTTKHVLAAPNGSIMLVDNISFSDAVGIEKLNTVPVKIFPDPANEYLQINIPPMLYNGRLVVVDVLGKKIADVPLSGGQNIIATKNFPEGILFYRLFNDRKIAVSGNFLVSH